MNTIYKYALKITDNQVIQIPKQNGALSVGEQRGTLCLWALVNTTDILVDAHIKIIGTGHPIDDLDLQIWTFLGTVQMNNGLVFHIFVK